VSGGSRNTGRALPARYPVVARDVDRRRKERRLLSVMEQRYQAVLAVVQDGWKVAELNGWTRHAVEGWPSALASPVGRENAAVHPRRRIIDWPAEMPSAMIERSPPPHTALANASRSPAIAT